MNENMKYKKENERFNNYTEYIRLSKMCNDFELNPNTIYSYRKGNSNIQKISLENAYKISKALKINLNEFYNKFIGEENEKTSISKCNKDCCLHCGTNYCRFVDELQQLKAENKELKSYLNKIREEELKSLDIEWDEYETECRTTDYSNIVTLVEEALGENNE